MPGPAPKPADERARRNKTPIAMRLPSSGRPGRAPAWPVGYSPTAKAKAIWSDLWKTPQAAAWERLGWTRVVARYVEMLVAAERDLDEIEDPKVYAAMLAAQTRLAPELRQLEDRLGLNPLAMRRLEWVIDPDEVAQKRTRKTAAAKATGARSRYSGLRAVGGSDAPAAT